MSRLALGCVGMIAIAGCQDDVKTVFPLGLEPLEDNPLAADPAHPETIQFSSSSNDFIRVYGRGYIHVAPGQVWSTTWDPEVMAAACRTTSHTITPNAEPGSDVYELAYVVHYYVDDILDVEWDDAWRYGTIVGTRELPELGMIKHQKIQGSDFITLSAGTIEILATDDPEVSELSFVEHLDAIQATSTDVIDSVRHNYQAILAVAHGGAIPPCP